MNKKFPVTVKQKIIWIFFVRGREIFEYCWTQWREGSQWLRSPAINDDESDHASHYECVTVLGVRRITDIVMREQTTSMTSRAIAIPFQFLWGGLMPPKSSRKRKKKIFVIQATVKKLNKCTHTYSVLGDGERSRHSHVNMWKIVRFWLH